MSDTNYQEALRKKSQEEHKLSSGSQEKSTKLPEELTRELRQFTGLAASFFRAAAARLALTVTDLQVMDILESTGPSTAGQLGDHRDAQPIGGGWVRAPGA
jgi:hypothetical protein